MRRLLLSRLIQKASQPTASGFTLIEILLVVVLLAILAIAALNAFEGNEDEARLNVTKLEMVQLQKALLSFRKHTREFPCRVYRDSDYSPNTDMKPSYTFLSETPALETDPAEPSTLVNYELWCSDSLPADNPPENFRKEDMIQAENALTMLNRFPYDVVDYSHLLWNPDTQNGWNGPYISKEALKDGWGRPYKLLNPELAFNQTYRCQADGSAYALDDENYFTCLSPLDDDFDEVAFILPADIVRIVSAGPDGIFQSLKVESDLDGSDDFLYQPESFNNSADPCSPADKSDDLVLCLLR